ncbi:MAG: MFS transporter [Bryobacteraceae bacterium]
MDPRNRWLLAGVFALSSSINYLDRQVLAAVAPFVMEEFHLSNAEYGALATPFSIAYAAGAPLAGMMIDRLGLTRGITLAIALWSVAGILTGLGTGLASLAACRALLGLAEAGGVPAAGKAIEALLPPRERALGMSLNQAAISLGMIAAPPLAMAIATRWNWRASFIVTGALGLAWIPLWRAVGSGVAAAPAAAGPRIPAIARDPRMWLLCLACALSMVLYSLWSNWIVLFLIAAGAAREQAAWLSTLPPIASTLGGFAGGGLAYMWMRRGVATMPARLRVCLAAALLSLVTAVIPWLPGAAWATAGISASFFAVLAFSVNVYSMPLDLFGATDAAFSIALLTLSFGLMQALVSPLFGVVIDRWGYAPVCAGASLTPLAAWGILRWTWRHA